MSDVNDRPATMRDLAALEQRMVERMASKADLAALEQRLRMASKADLEALERRLVAELSAEMARASSASLEQFRVWFGALHDQHKGLAERQDNVQVEVASVRGDLDEHRRDTTVHRAPRRATSTRRR